MRDDATPGGTTTVAARPLRRTVLLAVVWLLAAGSASAQTGPLPVTIDRYRLDVDVDYESERLAGTARLDVRNTTDHTIAEVPLVLYRLLTVEAVHDAAGPLEFEQEVRIDPDVPTSQSNVVTVQLRSPLQPEADARITVRYGGPLLGRAETGMRYIKDHIDREFTLLRNDGQAFPLVGNGSLMALRSTPQASFDYHAEITVPDTLVAVSAAPTVSRQVEGGRATFVFESAAPSWRMDFAIGDYRTLEQGPIRIHHLAADSAGGARLARAAANGLDFFAELFGPLADDATLAIVELEDGYGSQTDVAAIMQSAAAFRDSARANELYHEISHLWNVPETDQPPARWQEGLATFLEWYAVETLEGEQVLDRIGAWLYRSVTADIPRSPSLREVPLVRWGEAGLSRHAYAVGGLFFCVLYQVAGEDATLEFIRAYIQTYPDGITARDLARFGKERLDPPAARLFDDWWLSTRWVDLVEGSDDVASLLQQYRSAESSSSTSG